MAVKKNKRGQGEGCIRQVKKDSWVAIITVGKNPDGSQKRRSFYGKTRQEVTERMYKALTELKTGLYVEPNRSTLGEWLDFYFKEYAENSVKLSTKVSYDLFIRKHIKPFIGNILLKDLRGDIIQKFYNDKLKNGRLDGKGGLNPKTIRNIHNFLHEALEQAFKNGLIVKNHCKLVTLPKRVKKEMRVLSPEEHKKLISAAKMEKLGIGIILDLCTGMRLGELLGIQWKDIDLNSGILTVRQTLNRLKTFNNDGDAKTSIVIGDTKTLKSRRQIPLHEAMVKELKKYKTEQKQEKLQAGGLYNDRGFLLTNSIGNPIEPRTYQDFFYKMLKRANIAHANFHCCRHTFATRALENGIPAKIVSEILGHSNISTTLDLYSHCSLEIKRESINKIIDPTLLNPVEWIQSEEEKQNADNTFNNIE